MTNIELKDIVFIFVSMMTVVPAFFVAFSRNILHSAFAFFFTLLGTSGLYFFINSEFLAVVQIIVYIGGVSVIILFAILLTKDINMVKDSNAISKYRAVLGGGILIPMFIFLTFIALKSDWIDFTVSAGKTSETTIEAIGELFLNKYLLPFEAVSILLLAVLIGSLVIARRSMR